jgi:hypothetical protein
MRLHNRLRQCTIYEPVVVGCPRNPLEECHLEVNQSLAVQLLVQLLDESYLKDIPERVLQVVKAFLTIIAVKKRWKTSSKQQHRASPLSRMLEHSPNTFGLCNYLGSQHIPPLYS